MMLEDYLQHETFNSLRSHQPPMLFRSLPAETMAVILRHTDIKCTVALSAGALLFLFAIFRLIQLLT
jgi:hypothetical protein